MFSSILCSINYYNKLKLNSVTQLERSPVSSTLMIKSYVDCNTSDVTGIFVYVACGHFAGTSTVNRSPHRHSSRCWLEAPAGSSTEKLAAASGRRRWPICWCCLDRGPGSFDVEDATTLSWSSAAVSEWVSACKTESKSSFVCQLSIGQLSHMADVSSMISYK